jgi:hypothetical protein
MKCLTLNGTVAFVILLGATISSYQPSQAEQLVPFKVTADHYAAATAATSGRCQIMPVQAGYGARAPGQPGFGRRPTPPDCDVQAAIPGAVPGTPSRDMTYHGGPTVQNATFHLLLLNCPSNCNTDWGNPFQFLTDLSASNFVHNIDQYVGSTANGRYAPGTNATASISEPHIMQVSDVQAAVIGALRAMFPSGGGGGYTHIYSLFLPPGQDTCFDPATCYSPDNPATFVFCAYHTSMDTTDAIGNPIHVLYTVQPYMNVNGCQPAGPYPNGILADSTNNVLSHEIFETISDPDGNAWFHLNGAGENGDLCNFFYLLNPLNLNGHSYNIQAEYSNKIHFCGSSAGVLTATHNFNYTAGPPPAFDAVAAKSDLLWANTASGQVVVWLMNGTSVATGGSPGSAASPWAVVGQRDFNGDGNADLLWRNGTTGQLLLWFLNGTSVSGGGSPGGATNPWSVAGTGDFNGDGFGDVLWYNSQTGQLVVWLLNGASIIGGGSPGTVPSPWVPAATGDFNGDGKTDVLWVNGSTGQLVIWLLNGSSLIGGGSPGSAPPPWTVAGTGDFNGDGFSDVLWYNSNTGQVVVWYINGASVAGGGGAGTVGAPWTVAETGDFNNDGSSDIAWYNTATGQVVLWLMHGTTVIGGGSPGGAAPPWLLLGMNAD